MSRKTLVGVIFCAVLSFLGWQILSPTASAAGPIRAATYAAANGVEGTFVPLNSNGTIYLYSPPGVGYQSGLPSGQAASPTAVGAPGTGAAGQAPPPSQTTNYPNGVFYPNGVQPGQGFRAIFGNSTNGGSVTNQSIQSYNGRWYYLMPQYGPAQTSLMWSGNAGMFGVYYLSSTADRSFSS